MSYLVKLKKLSLSTKRLHILGYNTEYENAWLCPSGAIIEDPKVGAAFVPNESIELAVLDDGWEDEIDPNGRMHKTKAELAKAEAAAVKEEAKAEEARKKEAAARKAADMAAEAVKAPKKGRTRKPAA